MEMHHVRMTRGNLGLARSCRRASIRHTRRYVHTHVHGKHTHALTVHVWPIKSHDVTLRKPIEQSVCGQNASREARDAISLDRRRSSPAGPSTPADNVTPQDHEWKCKLMGVAPVPEVIRIEASAIDSGASRVPLRLRTWRRYRRAS